MRRVVAYVAMRQEEDVTQRISCRVRGKSAEEDVCRVASDARSAEEVREK